jgi:hypothetical protein
LYSCAFDSNQCASRRDCTLEAVRTQACAYNNTRGSVLLAVLLHGSLNAGSVLALFPDLPFSTRSSLLFLTVIPLAAGIASLLFGSKRLSKHRDENRLSLHAQREKESAR